MKKISIITVCWNSAKTIANAIQSVVNQNYSNIEYIIIDGGSTDDTLDIIHQYRSVVTKLHSGPDKGIYDAMNKGLRIATGDYVGILNSDDVYADYDILTKVVEKMETEKTDSVYGDLVYVAEHNPQQITRYWKAGNFNSNNFRQGWMIPHPTFFVRREIYQKYGMFNPSFRIAGDYELTLRFLYRYRISASYLPEVLVVMRTGGASNQSLHNRIKANVEDKRAWLVNQIPAPVHTRFFKPIRKIPQLFRYPKRVNFFPV